MGIYLGYAKIVYGARVIYIYIYIYERRSDKRVLRAF